MFSKLNDLFFPRDLWSFRNRRRTLLVDDRHTYFRILVLKMAESFVGWEVEFLRAIYSRSDWSTCETVEYLLSLIGIHYTLCSYLIRLSFIGLPIGRVPVIRYTVLDRFWHVCCRILAM